MTQTIRQEVLTVSGSLVSASLMTVVLSGHGVGTGDQSNVTQLDLVPPDCEL